MPPTNAVSSADFDNWAVCTIQSTQRRLDAISGIVKFGDAHDVTLLEKYKEKLNSFIRRFRLMNEGSYDPFFATELLYFVKGVDTFGKTLEFKP